MDSVIKRLNSEFPMNGFDIERLLIYQKQIDEEKCAVEKKISMVGGKFPDFVNSAIQKVEKNNKRVEEVTEQLMDLEESVMKHEARVEDVQRVTQEFMDKISLLENAAAYLKTLERVDNISQSLESALDEKSRRAVTDYTELCSLLETMKNSQCKYLLQYLNDTVCYWHAILKEKFTKEFDEVLKSLKWPFLGANVVPTPSVDLVAKFQTLIETLIQIQLPAQCTGSHEKPSSSVASSTVPLNLPIALLVRPLKKRFVYHFTGTRQTNQADKPEWYFTQILTWARDHQEFVEKHVQPVYDRVKLGHISARIEFIRGLVQVAMEKLGWDLPNLAHDDLLFSHTVDEALGFDRELRDGYGYPEHEASVLSILTKAQNFQKWINLEKKYSLEKLDTIMRSPSAFQPNRFVDEGELTTECVDSFVTLLSTLTDRYHSLQEPGHKLQFLQLQLDLLDDFRVRLLQLVRVEENSDLLSSSVPCILNSIRGLINVLEEWTVTPHFLHLSYFKSQMDNAEGKSDVDFDESSVFGEIIGLFKRMEENLLANLSEAVFIEVKARSRAYRKDRWHAMEQHDGLTPSSVPMFQKLTELLRILHQVLTTSLRYTAILHLARDLDMYLYEEIVEVCHFSLRGAQQFSFDIRRNLIPLFGQYIDKPDAHFRMLVDSCELLNLAQGTALLLHSRLANPQDDDIPTADVLSEVRVFSLNAHQVKSILQRRTDLAGLQ